MFSALPLALTGFRLGVPLALLPLLIWGGPGAQILAAVLFTLAALTDWLDGLLARALGQVTRWGKILDPIADKMLSLSTLLALVARDGSGDMLVWLALLMLGRELLMAGLREGSAVALPVSPMSRAKTFLTYMALGLLILGGSIGQLGLGVLAGALVLGYGSLALSIWRVARP